MFKSFQDWFTEGETLYTEALAEYQALEGQIQELELRLAEKRTEVNQMAVMLGKPAVENNKRLTAQLVDQPPQSGVVGAVTRALTGRNAVTAWRDNSHR